MGYAPEGKVMFVLGDRDYHNDHARFIGMSLRGVDETKYKIVKPDTDLLLSVGGSKDYVNHARERIADEYINEVGILLQMELCRGILLSQFFSSRAFKGIGRAALELGFPANSVLYVGEQCYGGSQDDAKELGLTAIGYRDFVRLLASF